MTTNDIESRYAWQFHGGRGIDNCVPPQWLPIVAELCKAIEEAIPAADRSAFYWLDIKEKRGTIAVDYVAPTDMTDTIDTLVEAACAKLVIG
ncbi:hypothetical protein [Chromobacterium amazonense]|uniref:Uncharacterized protein n=1 Tax=Chromobacterium amazonense TaxID=1382803 RepID=A0ABU8V4W6_9NEIS|nr:hypothetical protein [Chromobacterium amazonense]MDQ4539021.1 hypothetical protein [Chromobacterium amazonense]